MMSIIPVAVNIHHAGALFGSMLGSIESFLILVIIAIISSIYNAVTKKKESAEKGQPGPRRPDGRPAPRLTTPTPRVSVSPPVISPSRSAKPESPSPRIERIPPVPVVERVVPRASIEESAAAVGSRLMRLEQQVEADTAAMARRMMDFADEEEKEEAELSKSAAARLATVVAATAAATPAPSWPRATARNAELAAAVRNPVNLRQFVLASTVLGSPRGLTTFEDRPHS